MFEKCWKSSGTKNFAECFQTESKTKHNKITLKYELLLHFLIQGERKCPTINFLKNAKVWIHAYEMKSLEESTYCYKIQ